MFRLRCSSANSLAQRHGHRGEIQMNQPRLRGIEHTLIDDDRASGRIVGEHGQQEIRTTQVGRRRRGFGTLGDQRLHRFGRAIPDTHFMVHR